MITPLKVTKWRGTTLHRFVTIPWVANLHEKLTWIFCPKISLFSSRIFTLTGTNSSIAFSLKYQQWYKRTVWRTINRQRTVWRTNIEGSSVANSNDHQQTSFGFGIHHNILQFLPSQNRPGHIAAPTNKSKPAQSNPLKPLKPAGSSGTVINS